MVGYDFNSAPMERYAEGLLWPYLNNRSVWRYLGNFLYFFVCYGNTSFRPVNFSVRITHPRETILNSVDHNASARRNTPFSCSLFVPLVRVGNMKGQVVKAVLVS